MPVDEDTLYKVAKIIGGEEAIKIVKVLKNNEELTDEEISEKTGINLNLVRKILYKLYNHSIVGLRRERDEGSGWFIFYWTLQPSQIDGFIINQMKRILEKLEMRLEYEKNHDFYYCFTPGCRRLSFEEAVEFVFKCPSCGKPLQHFDNTAIIEALSKKIEEIKRELGELGY